MLGCELSHHLLQRFRHLVYTMEQTIRALAAKPIQSLSIQPHAIEIQYEDGEILKEKNDLHIRTFLATLENVTCQRITPNPCCIAEKLDHYRFLGWESGDAVQFARGSVDLPIVFS